MSTTNATTDTAANTAALMRRLAMLEEIGVGPLWLKRDAMTEMAAVGLKDIASHAPEVEAAAPISVKPAPVSSSGSLSSSALVTPEPSLAAGIGSAAPLQRQSVALQPTGDAAWDDNTGSVPAATAPVRTMLTLCTKIDVADVRRTLFVARASSVQGSEELFDNILIALGMQKERTLQGDLGNLADQVAELQPSVLILMEPAAAQQMIDPVATFESLRGRVHRVGASQALVTYGVTHLLRHPADKRKAWDDFCLLTTLPPVDVADQA
jgi:hypothetical protein